MTPSGTTTKMAAALCEFKILPVQALPLCQGWAALCILVAFYTDWPCAEDNWQEPKALKACQNCPLCRENCPTNSITAGRFLIRAENCLGFLQELNPDYPYWVERQPSWQNALTGCTRCQFVCPMNRPYLHTIVRGPTLSEDETGLILSKTPWESLFSETQLRLALSGGIYPLVASNLRALIERQTKLAHG